MKILICGFMGSGKTSLLEKLKKNSGSYAAFHDLDDVLLGRFGESFKSLGDLIEYRGWDYFRRVESEVLGEFLSASDENLVLALGGGAWVEQIWQK